MNTRITTSNVQHASIYVFLLALCIGLVFSAPSISLEYADTAVPLSSNRWTSIKLTITDIDLTTLAFSPKLTSDQSASAFQTYSLSNSNGLDTSSQLLQFGFRYASSLTDSEGTVLGGETFWCRDLASDLQWFGLTPDSSTTSGWKAVVASDSLWEATFETTSLAHTWTFACPLLVTNSIFPTSTNLQFSADALSDGTVSQQTFNVSLNHPLPYFVEPSVVFSQLDLQYKSWDDQSQGASLTNTFSTNASGVYFFDLTSGPIYNEFYLQSSAMAPYFCSVIDASSSSTAVLPRIVLVDSNTVAIVIVDVSSLLNSATGQASIRCETYLDTLSSSANILIANEQLSVDLLFPSHRLSRMAAIPEYRSFFNVDVTPDADDRRITYKISTPRTLQWSHTPLQTNSTVVFSFDHLIEVATIELDSTEQSYRGFDGCQRIQATASFDNTQNTITLSDILFDETTFDNILSCSFVFIGATNTDDFALVQDKAGYVRVAIDGKNLWSYASNSIDGTYFVTASIIQQYSSFHVDQIVNSDHTSSQIIYSFSLQDDYFSIPLALRNPMLVLSLYGSQSFTWANTPHVLTCQHTLPYDSTLQTLTLQWNAETLSWNTPLTFLIGAERFHIDFKCSRTVDETQTTVNGINLRPRLRLLISTFDLIADKVYANSIDSQGLFPFEPTVPQPVSVTHDSIDLFHTYCLTGTFAVLDSPKRQFTQLADVSLFQEQIDALHSILVNTDVTGLDSSATLRFMSPQMNILDPLSGYPGSGPVDFETPQLYVKSQANYGYQPFGLSTPASIVRGGAISPLLLENTSGFFASIQMCWQMDDATYTTLSAASLDDINAAFYADNLLHPKTNSALLVRASQGTISSLWNSNSQGTIRSTISSCGLTKGFYVTGTYSDSQGYQPVWTSTGSVLCGNGQQCETDADCNSGSCSPFSNVCRAAMEALSDPPFVSYDYISVSQLQKQYSVKNGAVQVTISGAIFAIVVMMLSVIM